MRLLKNPKKYKRIQKNTKDSKEFQKDSKRFQKIPKESKRIQKTQMIKKLQRTYGQRIFSLKEAAIAQKANVSS